MKLTGETISVAVLAAAESLARSQNQNALTPKQAAAKLGVSVDLIYEPDRQRLDIPCDGAERIADVLIQDRSMTGFARFAAANPEKLGDRIPGIQGGWWKLAICVASEDGPATNIELVAACGDREDGPITLAPWEPRGELILAEQPPLGSQGAS